MQYGENDSHKYDDIIGLPHHVSRSHPQMSMHDRAAQFCPFAALTGHGDYLREAERLMLRKMETDSEAEAYDTDTD